MFVRSVLLLQLKNKLTILNIQRETEKVPIVIAAISPMITDFSVLIIPEAVSPNNINASGNQKMIPQKLIFRMRLIIKFYLYTLTK